jgi:hypothetical protein
MIGNSLTRSQTDPSTAARDEDDALFAEMGEAAPDEPQKDSPPQPSTRFNGMRPAHRNLPVAAAGRPAVARPAAEASRVQLTCKIDQSLHGRMKAHCYLTGTSITKLIEAWIEQHCPVYEARKAQPQTPAEK